jgi:hypothetical protein
MFIFPCNVHFALDLISEKKKEEERRRRSSRSRRRRRRRRRRRIRRRRSSSRRRGRRRRIRIRKYLKILKIEKIWLISSTTETALHFRVVPKFQNFD